VTRWDPTGAHNADVAVTGTPLSSVIKAGAATIKYDTSRGLDRGNEVGVMFISDAVADQANVNLDEPDATNGVAQFYGGWTQWPDAGGTASSATEFLAVRANGNGARLLIAAGGVCTLQGNTGTNLATVATLTLNTAYRFRLKCTPGTTTANGVGIGDIWLETNDTAGTPDFTSGTITNNFNGATSTNVTSARLGDPSTTVAAGFRMFATQFEFVTGSTMPTVGPVAKNTPPPATTGRYPRIAAGGTWRTT
jgi:hypothetical protein